MKAFLLAGGLGERLRPLTLQMPKCLVPVCGVPLLEIWLRLCERHGITEALLNVSQHADLVEAFLARRPRGGTRVRLVREERPIGTAGTVLANRAFTDAEDSFWVVYTDNLTDMDLDRMAAFHRSHDGLITMGLFRASSPRSAGIVELDSSGRVVAFTEKPEHPRSDLANAGLYLVRRPVLDMIASNQPLVDFGHHVLPKLVGRMHGYLIPGFYVDIGTPEALARAEAEWRSRETGAVMGSEGARQGDAPA
jgi:mannose-1-phosphate guanylyltransferase